MRVCNITFVFFFFFPRAWWVAPCVLRVRSRSHPLTQAEQLSKLVVSASEDVSFGASRRAKLRSAATAAVRVLELTGEDISPDLAKLLNQVRETFVQATIMICVVIATQRLFFAFCSFSPLLPPPPPPPMRLFETRASVVCVRACLCVFFFWGGERFHYFYQHCIFVLLMHGACFYPPADERCCSVVRYVSGCVAGLSVAAAAHPRTIY